MFYTAECSNKLIGALHENVDRDVYILMYAPSACLTNKDT
jgi:hypothetical protein